MLYKWPRKLSILWISVAHFRLGWLMLNWYILNSWRFCIVFILCQIITEIHCFWLEYRTKMCSRKKLYRGPSVYGIYIFWLFPCSSKITPRPPLQDSYTAYWLHWYLSRFPSSDPWRVRCNNCHIRRIVLFRYSGRINSSCGWFGCTFRGFPDSMFHGANMGPIWGRQDPGGPHVGPMIFAIWVYIYWKS